MINKILYGYLVIFIIISISSLGYYLDSLNPTVIQVCRNGCDDNVPLTKQEAQDKINRIFSYCDFKQKLDSGEIPPQNEDGSYNVINSIGLNYDNATHHLDNNACEWQKYSGVSIDSEGLDANWIGDEDYCSEWCDQNELYTIGCDQVILSHLAKYSNLLDKEFDGAYYVNFIGLPDGVTKEKYQECIDFIYEKRLAESKTKKLWKSTDDWNSLRLIRNDASLYCSSVSEESSNHCYSLEWIVFGEGNKKKETGWKLYPGGSGWTLPENSTLSPIYKKVDFGIQPLDFTAMLDDKIFVNKCESNGGVWNYTYHDCENLWQVCRDVGGIMIQEDITPPCTDTGIIDDNPLTIKVCNSAGIIRASCVIPYEN